MLKKLEMAVQAHMLVRTAQEHEEIRQAQAQLQLKIAAAEQEQAGLVAALSSLSQTNEAMLATTRCTDKLCCSRACMQHVRAGVRQPINQSALQQKHRAIWSPPLRIELRLYPGKHMHPMPISTLHQSLCRLLIRRTSTHARLPQLQQLRHLRCMCRPKGDADLKNRTAQLSMSQREASLKLLEADEDLGRLQVQAAGLQDELDELNSKLEGTTEALATLHRREVRWWDGNEYVL